MKLLCIFLCLLFPLHCWGQATIKEIRQEHPRHKGSYYSFPKIILENRSVAEKINYDLINDYLDIEPSKVKKSIFENVWGDKENISRLEGIEYSILLNSPGLFCVSLSADGCGAYCEYFTNYYTYDLKTGARYKLTDILTIVGQKFVLDSMQAGKKAEMLGRIKDVKDSLKVERIQSQPNDKEYYQGELELYQYCLENMDSYVPTLEFMRFYINENELHVIMERCSSHANRNVDELDTFEFVFEFEKMKMFLTADLRTKL